MYNLGGGRTRSSSRIRFKTLDALPLDVVGEAVSKVSVDDYIRIYERSRVGTRPAKQRAAARKPVNKTKAPAKRRSR